MGCRMGGPSVCVCTCVRAHVRMHMCIACQVHQHKGLPANYLPSARKELWAGGISPCPSRAREAGSGSGKLPRRACQRMLPRCLPSLRL